jgi:hydroxymethylglutaryl-CoA reductase
MNGIDALAIATGNDWRAIEAGAHAYAARDGRYRSLSRWSVGEGGELIGELTLPLKLGVVGGTLDSNPAAGISLAMTGVESAVELAQLAAAVGLGQNFAALRALATTGIQDGHMRLHARSVVAAAGVPDEQFEGIVDELVASGEIKGRRAGEILRSGTDIREQRDAVAASGKVILLGEHAVVYGRHALALPLPGAVTATAGRDSGSPGVSIPAWGYHAALSGEGGNGVVAAVELIAGALEIDRTELADVAIVVDTMLPRAMGLGSSAAIAVAIVRALAKCFGMDVDDERVNEIAFDCEKLAHGMPSGVDNTIATFSRPLLFRRGESLEVRGLELSEPPPIVIACSHSAGLTAEQVAGVRARRERARTHYDAILDEMDKLALEGAEALASKDYESLGASMNLCHGLLNAIGVSTPELERMIAIARGSGACGAKLTGAGGGGSIVALCPGYEDEVRQALGRAGFRTMRPEAAI